MPKNRIQKRNDGRRFYKTTINGKRRSIFQRKNEKLKDFEKRCDELDMLSENGNQAFAYSDLNIESTFDELFRTWQKDYQIPNCSKADISNLEQNYKNHVKDKIGSMPLYKINKQLIYRLLTELVNTNYSKGLIDKVRSCISRPFNWASNQLGLEITNPTKDIRLKYRKSYSNIRVISKTEANLFFNLAKDTKYFNYFKILYLTGLRPSEALGLQRNDIKKDSLKIQRGITRHEMSDLKTESGKRSIPITEELHLVLKDQLAIEKNIWLFPSNSGAPSMNAIENCFKRIMRKLRPIHFSLYDFRHTFATKSAESGMPFKVLQTLMGHKDINVTLKYYVGLSQEEENQMNKYMANLHTDLLEVYRHEQNVI